MSRPCMYGLCVSTAGPDGHCEFHRLGVEAEWWLGTSVLYTSSTNYEPATLESIERAITLGEQLRRMHESRALWSALRVTNHAALGTMYLFTPPGEDPCVVAHPQTVADVMAANLAAAYRPEGVP